MLGRQSSDERLYMKRQNGGRGSKSLKDVYGDTSGCYMANASIPRIKKHVFEHIDHNKNTIIRMARPKEKNIDETYKRKLPALCI